MNKNFAAIAIKLIIIIFCCVTVFAYEDPIIVNYDIGRYKYLIVGETLEITCENTLNKYPPSWIYPARLFNDPRMKVHFDNGSKSRLELKNAVAADAGQFGCGIDYEYGGKTIQINKTIEVIVNKISNVLKEETEEGIKLLCDVQAYPPPNIFWKIDYDNKELNPEPEEPDVEDDYWVPSETKVVVEKSVGRFMLRQYNGINKAELFIANITKDDDGIYYCFAQNIAGDSCEECSVRHKREMKANPAGAESSKTTDTTEFSIPTEISKIPGKQSETSVPETKGFLEAESTPSMVDVACLILIITGNVMLIYIILVIRGNRVNRDQLTELIKNGKSGSEKDEEAGNGDNKKSGPCKFSAFLKNTVSNNKGYLVAGTISETELLKGSREHQTIESRYEVENETKKVNSIESQNSTLENLIQPNFLFEDERKVKNQTTSDQHFA